MPDTPVHPGPDEPTSELEPLIPPADPGTPVAEEGTQETDTGRNIRTWVWMILVSGFGLFLVFGSVRAHFWEENARGTFYVPVTEGMQVLDIWRAQLNGLPEVAHQSVLKAVFLVSVFGFLGLSVIALWLATVEIWSGPSTAKDDSASSRTGNGPATDVSPSHGASAG